MRGGRRKYLRTFCEYMYYVYYVQMIQCRDMINDDTWLN